jgi:hypothetical protein
MYRLQKKPLAHKEAIQHLKHEFCYFCGSFCPLDPDTDPYSNYGSGYGSNGPIEYGSNPDPDTDLDPDPKPCNSGD